MFLPASSIGDDIEIYTDETRREVAMTWRNLRQQNAKREGIPNKSLADYIAPKSSTANPAASRTTSASLPSPPVSGPRKRSRIHGEAGRYTPLPQEHC